eukprot:CAMPEP_0170068434 /NCGR_PEP_ID=MMETSP0019_2-20121128/7411_1 /TAXON_ID=98059 /ORGANISM="Dinobryon sp., Strain UTEXLB2267" /LENGTH=565 /DNA_ID=CAMNT_0010276079 /DNA_START=27 /DNA_END=1724 /DNA_ORIENTATION=-
MFQVSFLVILLTFVSCNAGSFKLIEKSLISARDDFLQSDRADINTEHEVVFAIEQNNLDKLESLFYEVSDPTKKDRYGKFLTREEVKDLTANPVSTDFVVQFLMDNDVKKVKPSVYGEYIKATAPIAVWEKLFATTFFTFNHVEKSVNPVLRALEYSLPLVLVGHVAAVFNTVQLPPRLAPKPKLMLKDSAAKAGSITPALLNSYYGVTSNTGNSLGSQAVFESLGQYYSPSDLALFQENYNLPSDSVDAVVGGYESDEACATDANNCVEANLDVQYMMAMSQLTPTTYWYEGASDSFLAWIQAVADSSSPPLVNSISYGSIETELPKSFAKSFNTEAMKLGVQGVTILVSSGDDGVANFQARSNPRKCGYNPSFPATSPYVTAVGATQGPESNVTETACLSNTGGVITTGGGFSSIFSAPSYQTETIATYFASLSTSETPSSGYASGGRGYPDIAMAGLNYEVVVGGKTYQVSGTSASAPVVAGMVALVNADRLKAGKSPLGFLNQAIYSSGLSITNDVLSGENNCCASLVCCDEGFYAAKGWDPLTGFGSVNYSSFYKTLVNL